MLMGWADSNWARSHNCRRSTLGYVFIIDGLMCSWSSRLQPMVANSSMEAEYMALAAAARELLWTSMFLHELEQPMLKATEIHVSVETLVLHSHDWDLIFNRDIPVLHSDLSGTCTIANDPQHFKRTKHINIAHFFLRDKIVSRQLTIAPVQSSKNLANIMTKLLAAPTLLHHCHSFRLTTSDRHAGSRGGDKGNNQT
ncbi:hypothetical protein NDA14_000703 [Ustilago hordei]|nr:hypothetical protein NDA10_007146 [Ustilago hordei]KAJ1600085.1 hypothetical protein NDA14_000703 [Ustilago hordei]